MISSRIIDADLGFIQGLLDGSIYATDIFPLLNSVFLSTLQGITQPFIFQLTPPPMAIIILFTA